MCAKFFRQFGSVGATVDRDNLESHVTCILHAKVTEPTNPKHRD